MPREFNTYTCIPVEDLGRARALYRDVLELEVEEDVEDGTFYKSNKSRLYVFRSAGKSSGTHTQMALTVRD